MYYNINTKEQKDHYELCQYLNASIPYDTEKVGEDWYLIHIAPLPNTEVNMKAVYGDITIVDDRCIQNWKIVPMSEDEIKTLSEEQDEQSLAEKKSQRTVAVSNIVVEVDGMKFDGNEVAQARMSRVLLAHYQDQDAKISWVLADNSVAEVFVWQLKKALEQATAKQAELWIAPYVPSEE